MSGSAVVPSIPVVKDAGKAKRSLSGRTDSRAKRLVIHLALAATAWRRRRRFRRDLGSPGLDNELRIFKIAE